MTREQILLILIPAAYLVGSIPFGLVVGLAKGIDPRKAGSGNIGATNVGRLLGGKYFALVFTLDLLKGAVPTLAAGAVLKFRADDQVNCLIWMIVAITCIVGHVFSIFLKFRGGKGVATSAGAILGIFPFMTLPGVVAVLVFVMVFYSTRYVSLASIIGSAAIPVAYVVIGHFLSWPVFNAQLPLLVFSVLVPLIIVYRHRENIVRLRAGTENRFARKTL